ncbi:spore germination protein [Anaerobacterium chartisolvens]|uniref:Spore germination protein n=1 Tax=Anaerobacterium chartisolvens TaxID=1297424 RepID=A0A369B4X2_9FIRM|nr:glycosyl hydrolase family 18 protein [Anaerobacterium chartisolvens]RCX16579.1 spore germination protein [Anaerobacterium chartisolvens]
MIIHIVQSGDTVWLLSRKYGVSAERITAINGLQQLPNLVVGQALVMPTTERPYTVAVGDSLWSIGRRFNIPYGSIIELNRLVYPYVIYPGMVLRIPQPYKNYGYIEVNAYIEPTTDEAGARRVNEVGRHLTYLSPFSYQVSMDGTLNSINDNAAIQAARQYRVAPLMVITNFRDGNFDSDIARAILRSESIQDSLIRNVTEVMRNKGYYGINIDFERIPPEDRELYNSFLRRVTNALHAQNFYVSTALAPKTSDYQTGVWHGAHDYKAHGEIVDFVIIMTYEWGWSGGPPYAVAPIDKVREVLEYAVSVMPSNKIMMGIPLYGYDWKLPYVEGGPWARSISPVYAVELAARYNQSILYDVKTQAPHFNYTDNDGTRHEVWFEDARSIEAKFRLASELGLRGVSYWVLGMDFPQNWYVLDNMFNIVKLIR